MHTKDQIERVTWRDGAVPVSTLFEDTYFSLTDGLAETRHVFLEGNALPARFRDGFRIAELGFGTGLNLIATLIAWQTHGAAGRLSYTSFEAFPMPADDMARALAAFPEIHPEAAPLLAVWTTGARRFVLGPVDVEIIEGDARDALPDWQGRADAWFLDGFSPAKNPELWSEVVMAEVARHTTPGGTLATYTAAGFVRRGLQAAGFQIERAKGYGHKRHMTRGILGEAT
ncbi:tRNA 5-methylaminomethyl-2-thiouridine biosynthesis bifunctional protein MnmC [Defluviimonas aquaemixtae]|uniref:tRNA 5-methylaminomethyl-2-thiouridine biosynthesis bifunctional protein MnmC n=1 Tax=Albidovulum aquaemixtae TaxID=1542388 RepID=A0A2R8BLX0_9RHOB|nr:tRNA (5-methylaminomethyl-2-thiouridine)(34)-methyltransferase MnmD [Defluviimonas aquaemixtae]SPH24333.1 tRNA 5-methylaminomethyl-2-thiouridine biosynthesis bifunctional protein MnmC [Defluviimonas aquaemixtae]